MRLRLDQFNSVVRWGPFRPAYSRGIVGTASAGCCTITVALRRAGQCRAARASGMVGPSRTGLRTVSWAIDYHIVWIRWVVVKAILLSQHGSICTYPVRTNVSDHVRWSLPRHFSLREGQKAHSRHRRSPCCETFYQEQAPNDDLRLSYRSNLVVITLPYQIHHEKPVSSKAPPRGRRRAGRSTAACSKGRRPCRL